MSSMTDSKTPIFANHCSLLCSVTMKHGLVVKQPSLIHSTWSVLTAAPAERSMFNASRLYLPDVAVSDRRLPAARLLCDLPRAGEDHDLRTQPGCSGRLAAVACLPSQRLENHKPSCTSASAWTLWQVRPCQNCMVLGLTAWQLVLGLAE